MPATATQGLNLIGAATANVSGSAQATLTDGNETIPVSVPLTAPTVRIPPDGSAFTLHFAGVIPAESLRNAFVGGKISIGALSMNWNPILPDGSPTSLGTCTVR